MLQSISAVINYLSQMGLIVMAALAIVLSLGWVSPVYAGSEGTAKNGEELEGTERNLRELTPLSSYEFPRVPLVSSLAITATKTYTLATDTDGDNQADPGDVLSYTIVITNNGVTTNTGVIFSDSLDASTNLNGLVSISPVAFDDSYNANANPITLNIPDGSTDLFANDYPGLNPAVSGIASFGGGSLGGAVTSNAAGSTVSAANGAVTVNANGSLVFTPAVSFQGVFSFAYRLQNPIGPSDSLVRLTVDAPPTVTSTSPISGAINVNAASNITLNFSENVAIAAGGITVGCPAAVSFTPTLPVTGVNSITLNPTTNLPGGATCTVTALSANVTDSDANDPPNNLDGDGDNLEGGNYTFTFGVAPTANDDSYNVTPHLTLGITATTGVRANDDPTSVTITGFGPTLGTANGTAPPGPITTGLAGMVTLNADGSFSYSPPPNVSNTTDSFFYTVTGGDTATVTLTIQNQNLIWFVDATAAGGNGTQARPFNLLTGALSFDAIAADNSGDFIFIADGAYTCGLTLLNNQTVVGDGSSSTLQALTGVTPVSGSSLPAFSGADPVLSNAGGDCLTLGSGNTIRGLTIANTSATGSDISGTNFGTLTMTETTLNGTGRALNLNTGTFNATLDGLTSTSGTNNVNLVSVGGTANLGSGALSGASSDAFVVNGGTVSVTYSGSITQTNNGALVSVSGGHTTGTLTFQTGTLNATNGTGLQFDNADGVYNFNGTTTLNGGNAGVDILNGSDGTFNFGTGAAITSPSGMAFNVNSGAPNVTYNGNITQNTSSQRVVNIDGTTGGTVSFASPSTVTGGANSMGVNINNANGNVAFNNLTLGTSGSRINNQAVTISGGTGTYSLGNVSIFTNNVQGIVATNADGTLNSASGTVDAGNNTAVNIDGPGGLTTLGMTLTRVDSDDASGSAPGIIIQDTNGSFIVNGDGTNTAVGGNSSGGVISGKSGADGATNGNDVFLSNASGVTLRRMTINGTNQNHGIRGVNVSNFTLEYSTVSGTNGTNIGIDEGSINFDNLTGTATMTSCSIDGGLEDNLNVVNTNGTLNRLTITGSTFGFNDTTNGNNNILIEAQNAGTTLNFTIQSSIIRGARADWLNASNNSSSTMDAVIGGATIALGNTFSNLGADANPGAAAGGNRIVFGATGILTYDINNNTVRGSKGSAIFVRSTGTAGGLTGTATGRVRNNVIGIPATSNSGSSESSGIFIFGDGGSDHTTLITNNQVFQYNNHGIRLLFGDEINNGSSFAATLTNNTVNTPGNILSDFNGFNMNNGSVGATDDFTTCLNIQDNNFTGGGQGTVSPNNNDVRLQHRMSTTVQLPGYTGPARDNTDGIVDEVITYLRPAGSGGLKNNTFGTGTANSVTTGGGYVNSPGGADCTQP